jgi:putative intracellular protease/amidase
MIRRLACILGLMFAAGAAEARPSVVLLADPKGVETTDLLAPYAILSESGAVEVTVVSSSLEPAPLMPGVGKVKPQATWAAYDRAHPQGPDMVIVPFMMSRDPQRAAWLRDKARQGARIVSICDGALILADAGLLDGRQATAHWASRGQRLRKYPKVAWRTDARWVTDGRITTTAGVSASVPASLALLEELAGDGIMRTTAARLGLGPPDRRHDAQRYRFDRPAVETALVNVLMPWRREAVSLPLAAGFDELAFGFKLDAWSRTFRSKAYAVTPADGVVSRHGLRILGRPKAPAGARQVRPDADDLAPVFAEIRRAYGAPTARLVALQLEHPEGASQP